MSAKPPIHDGLTVDASDVAKLTCPGCGEPLGLNVDKPNEGIDHPDCGFRFGIGQPGATTTAAQRYTITMNKLEVPIRTFAEDKKAKKEEAKEAKDAEKEQAKAAEKARGRK